MSDATGPQRIEVLESDVGEMKVELFHTSKAALGRGDANDDSDGAGRAPRKEGVALAQGLASQQQLLQREKCPTTAAEPQMDQDLPATRGGDQMFELAWARL